MQRGSKFAIFLLLAISACLVYLGMQYHSLYQSETAYIYHPETERVYRLELVPSMAATEPYRLFLPEHQVSYTEPSLVEFAGSAGEPRGHLEEEADVPEQREGESVAEWTERAMEEIDNAEYSYLDIEYFERDEPIEPLMDDLHPDIRSAIEAAETYNLTVVDAVAITWYTGQSSPEVQSLEDAVMLRDAAAARLERAGY